MPRIETASCGRPSYRSRKLPNQGNTLHYTRLPVSNVEPFLLIQPQSNSTMLGMITKWWCSTMRLRHVNALEEPKESSSQSKGTGIHVELKGPLVDALRQEIREEVIEQLREQWKEEVKEELREELMKELLPIMRVAVREEVSQTTSSRMVVEASSPSPTRRGHNFGFSLDRSRKGSHIFDTQGMVGSPVAMIREATGHHPRSSDPIELVLFTDMGGAAHDCGDAVALFLLRGLEGLHFVNVSVSLSSPRPHSRRACRAAASSCLSVVLISRLGA